MNLIILKSKIPKIVGSIILCFVLWGYTGACFAQQDLDHEIEQLESFAKVYQLIKSRYYKDRSGKQLIDAAIQGMIDSLDKHTQVLDKKTMSWLEKQSIGNYSGIGVSLEYQDHKLIIGSVIPDSPAGNAGLKPEDVIIKINDIDIKSSQPDAIFKSLSENSDQLVQIEYYQPIKPNKILKVSLKKTFIQNHSVELIEYSPTIMIIKIKQFQKHTASEIIEGMAHKNHSSIFIDLRNNPGGLLLSAIETAQIFISAGLLVEVKDKKGFVIEKYVSRNRTAKQNIQLYVLMNKMSASASEILAGAIKDSKKGLLIGEQSYGKGTVQTVYPIHKNMYVKMTTAKYYTASGISFDRIGVTPHFKVKDSKGKAYSKKDFIFQKALLLSRKKLSEKTE